MSAVIVNNPSEPKIDENRAIAISMNDANSATDPPPDGGYGWVCVASVFIINGFTWGIKTYGVYLAHYLSAKIYPDASSIDFAFIGGLNFSMAMLVAPIVTILARICGTQAPMLLGAIILAAGYITASFAHRIWQLYLSQGVLVGFGVGFVSIPSIAILSQWFEKKRSLASGIGSAGSGIGGLIFSFATQAMIDNLSLAWSLRITGIIAGTMNVIAALMIRNRNKIIKPPQRGFDTKLLRRYDVLLLLSWSFISMLGYITILFSLSDFARSIGLSASKAAAVSAFLNLGTAIGRPLVGVASDYFGRMETAGVLTLICGIMCFAVWLPATSYGVTILFVIISGAFFGVFWMTIGPITFAEVIALELRRPVSGHDYLYPQIFAGVAYIVASGCMYELRRFTRKLKLREV
ncbi:MFS transporter, MCP family, solute carrier family 16, member 6 [Usnea florida]